MAILTKEREREGEVGVTSFDGVTKATSKTTENRGLRLV
jgi:hypothetical protein